MDNPQWLLGLLSENRTGRCGISARRPFHGGSNMEVWWSAASTGEEIAAALRELANRIEADD